MLSHNYYKKSAASYNNKNNNKHYIQTIEDPFIIRDQISIPITSRHKEPNPERYGNTVCDDYIENIPKSKVSYAKIFPSFSTREPVNNFRIQNEQELINENNNIYIKEFPVYLCINSFSENNDIFKNKYKMTFKIDFQVCKNLNDIIEEFFFYLIFIYIFKLNMIIFNKNFLKNIYYFLS